MPVVPATEHRVVIGLEGFGPHFGLWGWRTTPPPHAPLMHIFACTPGGRLAVVLEGPPGVRCFRPDPRLPLAVVLALKAELEHERAYVEACWASDVTRLGWVEVEVVGDAVEVVVYVGSQSKFVRRVEVPDVVSATWDAGDEQGWLMVEVGDEERRLDLGPLIWR